MKIMHNLMAMNANRNRRKNTNSLAKNLEKLSSGYKINRAADDAAGLAISEKMRAQITGLTAAHKNASDGISLVQTAEGAMQEIHDMLTRLGQLSTQAANSTYSQAEREAIQKEVDQLLEEISRIRENTKFSEIPLLMGDGATITRPGVSVQGGLPAWVDQPQLTDQYMSGTYTTTETHTATTTNADGTTTTTTTNYLVDHAASYLDFSDFDLDPSKKTDLLGNNVGFYSTCCTCPKHYSIKFNDGEGNSTDQSGDHFIYNIDISGVNSAQDLVQAIVAGTTGPKYGLPGNPNDHYTKLIADPNNPNQLIVYDNRGKAFRDSATGNTVTRPTGGSWGNWTGDGAGSSARPSPSNGWGVYGQGVAYDPADVTITARDIVLQIGPDGEESSRMPIDLPDMGLDKIGILGLSVLTEGDAMASMDKVYQGVDYVSTERARMGAYQNRLEHALANLAVTKENLQKSESIIRDTDMAEEMMAYTKNNILIQASQAMLAQANNVPQGVLQMLQ